MEGLRALLESLDNMQNSKPLTVLDLKTIISEILESYDDNDDDGC